MHTKNLLRFIALVYISVFIVMPLSDIHIIGHGPEMLGISQSPGSTRHTILNFVHEMLYSYFDKQTDHASRSKLQSLQYKTGFKSLPLTLKSSPLHSILPMPRFFSSDDGFLVYATVRSSTIETVHGHRYFLGDLSPPYFFS